MEISEAIQQRKSIRAFKPDPVPPDTLKRILEEALRAPSWANTQPWEFAVAAGKPLDEIRSRFLAKGLTSPAPDVPRPPEFPERYAARIRVLDKQNRLVTQKDWDSRRVQNFRHYGAPAVIYLLTGREFYYQTKGLNVWALHGRIPPIKSRSIFAVIYTSTKARAVNGNGSNMELLPSIAIMRLLAIFLQQNHSVINRCLAARASNSERG